MSMAKPLPLLFLDGGLSSLLEEEVGALHPKLWSSALLLTEEGCEAVISSHEVTQANCNHCTDLFVGI
eukprot:m.74304 g.74304  ORF g.74304 m.74304 type:complete len:68 (+) comp12392_c0_seq3:353-556(+)